MSKKHNISAILLYTLLIGAYSLSSYAEAIIR